MCASPPNLSILINDPLIVAKCQLSLAPDTTQEAHRCRRAHTQTQMLHGHPHQTTRSHLQIRYINTMFSVSTRCFLRTPQQEKKMEVKSKLVAAIWLNYINPKQSTKWQSNLYCLRADSKLCLLNRQHLRCILKDMNDNLNSRVAVDL